MEYQLGLFDGTFGGMLIQNPVTTQYYMMSVVIPRCAKFYTLCYSCCLARYAALYVNLIFHKQLPPLLSYLEYFSFHAKQDLENLGLFGGLALQ